MNQDPKVTRGALVFQWPQATWPNTTGGGSSIHTPALSNQGGHGAPPAPFAVKGLAMAPCDAADATQRFYFNASDSQIRTGDGQLCLTYGEE